MKRGSYKKGVEFIAMQQPRDLDPERIGHYATTILLAEVFGKPYAQVARDIAIERQERINKEVAAVIADIRKERKHGR